MASATFKSSLATAQHSLIYIS